MPEIINLQVETIDPDSTVNVRRAEISANVERIEQSISRQGYWQASPITVRPHPSPESHFEYEVVAGQCRLKACLNLGLNEIPAVILELDSDNAIQHSWAENEFRGELTPSDKAYWIHRIVRRYTDEGRSIGDARKIAATYFNISESQVINYHPLIALPADVKELLDQGRLQLQDATVIAKHSYDYAHPEESEERIRERVNWIQSIDVDERKAARKAIGHFNHNAPLETLKQFVKEELERQFLEERVQIPQEMHDRLIAWGEERGLTDVSTSVIIKYIIAETLRR